MVVLLHGAAGNWDELAIAVAALAVLWIAFKLAGRKRADEEDEVEEAESGEAPRTPDPLPEAEGASQTPSRLG